MGIDDLMAVVASALDAVGVSYVVTGSMASIFYGEPRTTADVDIIADLKPEQVAALHAQFSEQEYYFSEEAAHDAIRLGHTFNIIHSPSGFKADIILPGRDVFTRARLRRGRVVTTRTGAIIKLSAPEDVILSKLQFYREGGSDKHLRDIAGMLRLCQVEIDRDYIAGLAEQWGVGDVWRKLLES